MHGLFLAFIILVAVMIGFVVAVKYQKTPQVPLVIPASGVPEGFLPADYMHRAKKVANSFSNTLQRRLGMSSAAESYSGRAPGSNTVWGGYMKPSVLPY